jgi:hypothetical protein
MKVLAAVMALFAVIYYMSAFTQKTGAISGRSRPAAFKSAKEVKRYMTPHEQHLFETSFWALMSIKSKEEKKDGEDPFLEAVGGKTPEEVIELAKQEVNAKIASGDPDFKRYRSWEDLIDEKKPGEDESAQPLRNSSRTGRPE